MKETKDGRKLIGTNSYARFNYYVHETMEAGIVLRGDEVKSLREGKVNLKEGYVMVSGGEVFLRSTHISKYSKSSDHGYEPLRTRKLLLHKAEIKKLTAVTREKGLTIIPLKMYFINGLAKAQLGICKGKQQYDKRQSIKEREQDRELQRAMKS